MKKVSLFFAVTAILMGSCTKNNNNELVNNYKDSTVTTNNNNFIPKKDTVLLQSFVSKRSDTVTFDKMRNVVFTSSNDTADMFYLWLSNKKAITGTVVNVYYYTREKQLVEVYCSGYGFRTIVKENYDESRLCKYFKITYMGTFQGNPIYDIVAKTF